ncbi:hypothetical protein IUY40_13960 [Flavobacterium sp. ALJ2]|uniref:hypothetical protein n=1 Tax=Flavobacterium sp. ALJ2 TaxID=2786960 RepID=UPI00189F4822|nr:hypothetical protein [Flavobacterium sp. ALJ2]MBF7092637.1 hypothetical protein [Flavobacterium sp. ALJ2]
MKLKYLKNIKDPYISKEKFDYILNVKNKLDYNKWIQYVDSHQNYFTWYENTEDGIYKKNNMDKVPESFREKEILYLDKKNAHAEYNTKKGFYEVILSFNYNLGIISTTFQKKITKEHLKMLLEMANHLDAYLLNSGKTIIDEKVVKELE